MKPTRRKAGLQPTRDRKARQPAPGPAPTILALSAPTPPAPARAAPAASVRSAGEPRPAHAQPPGFESFDRMLRAILARTVQGVSPTAVASAWADWAVHLASAPGKQLALATQAARMAQLLAVWQTRSVGGATPEPVIAPGPDDARFADPAWSQWPYSAMVQGYLLAEAW